jgi:1-acyl-sn-glycerol-3-phosphate acyltransferase
MDLPTFPTKDRGLFSPPANMSERIELTGDLRDEKSRLEKAIGLAMWAPGVAWLTGMMSTMMLVQRFVPSDRIEWLTRIYTSGQALACGTRVRHVVHPAVDPKQVYVFAQNHVNLLDHCTMYNATPHFKQGIELARHFEIPVYGWYMKQRGTIPVLDEGASPKEAYKDLSERIRAEVQKGHSMLVFPEGTRTLDGRVGPFQGGIFRITHGLGLPIVPVAVTGMYEVMHKGEPYINPGRVVTVYVEEPIETKGVSKGKLPELIERVRSIIAARVDAYNASRVDARQATRVPTEQPVRGESRLEDMVEHT